MDGHGGVAEMDGEAFSRELEAVRARGGRFVRRAAGPPTPTAVPSPAPDGDTLAETLQRVVGAAIPLLRADGAGLVVADADGTGSPGPTRPARPWPGPTRAGGGPVPGRLAARGGGRDPGP